jgi:hypothetical protein
MTPQEERDAIIEYVAGLGNTDRHTLLSKLVTRHNSIVGTNKYNPTISEG